MEEARVTRQGSALVPLDGPGEEAIRAFPEGSLLKVKITRPRSKKHNGFFHVCIQEAYDVWPRSHEFQPVSWKHLRAWLLVKAKHAHVMTLELTDDQIKLVGPVIRAFKEFMSEDDEDQFIFTGIRGNALIAMRPKTLSFAAVDQHWFQPIADEVFATLKEEAGFDVEEHYQEWKKRNEQANNEAGTSGEDGEPGGADGE